eukprot:135207-Pyramimonas_sp.AAC.1
MRPNADIVKEIGQFLSTLNSPWVVAGDFNTPPNRIRSSRLARSTRRRAHTHTRGQRAHMLQEGQPTIAY